MNKTTKEQIDEAHVFSLIKEIFKNLEWYTEWEIKNEDGKDWYYVTFLKHDTFNHIKVLDKVTHEEFTEWLKFQCRMHDVFGDFN